ncbi:MAG: amino acid permease [Bacillota bacterium]|nr:MAG: amino acid permease [Bacillota bacterium]
MISIGGVIGVGVFLGSGSTVRLAGPGVILSYVIGGVIMFLVMSALAEMTVARPAPGSFRLYAHDYLGPYFGFLTGWTYWLSWVAIMSAEIVAASTYVRLWVPASWSLYFGLGFALLMTVVNLTAVESFGEFEFWFSLVKVGAIVAFILTGAAFIFGFRGTALGTANYAGDGGFLPFGLTGVVLATALVIFAYGGTEVIGVAAGESENPRRDVPRAIGGIVVRTIVLYIGAIAVLVGVVPWREVGLTRSPFVLVFEMLGLPWASAAMNVVVITAALSSMNAGLYTASRILYSLAREGQAPAVLGRVLPKRRVPAAAVLTSTASLYAGVLIYYLAPANAFLYVTSVSAFGIAFTWLMIVLSHIAFRPGYLPGSAAGTPASGGRDHPALAYRAPFYPWGSYVAALALVAVITAMGFLPTERVGLASGGTALGLVSLAYLAYRLRRRLRREPLPRTTVRPEPAYGLQMADFFGLRPEDTGQGDTAEDDIGEDTGGN